MVSEHTARLSGGKEGEGGKGRREDEDKGGEGGNVEREGKRRRKGQKSLSSFPATNN